MGSLLECVFDQPAEGSLSLRYVGERRRGLLHGSNDTEIVEFEPREQETYTGEPVEAVFATDDGDLRVLDRRRRLPAPARYVHADL